MARSLDQLSEAALTVGIPAEGAHETLANRLYEYYQDLADHNGVGTGTQQDNSLLDMIRQNEHRLTQMNDAMDNLVRNGQLNNLDTDIKYSYQDPHRLHCH